MKKALIKPLFFYILAFATSAFASFSQADSDKALANCQGGGFYVAEFSVEKIEEIKVRARAEIAEQITAEVESQSKIKDSKKELSDGVIDASGDFSTESSIKSKLSFVAEVREIEPPKPLEGGGYEFKGYMCRSDVARPWLTDFDAEVTSYSNLAIKIADEKDTEKRNELLDAAKNVKDSANRADIFLNPIASGGIPAEMSQRYSKLKEDFKAAEKKIDDATKMVHNKNYSVGLMPIVPGWAQLYKGHYGRAALIIGSEAVLLAIGGISLGNYNDADSKYKETVLKYNASNNLNEKNELLQKSRDYKSDRESAEKTAFAAFLLAGVVYAYNIVDGYATTPALARWHLAALPVPSRNGTGAALALTGNF